MNKKKIIYMISTFTVCLLLVIIIKSISFGVDSGYLFAMKGHIFDPAHGGSPYNASVGKVFCCEKGGELKSISGSGRAITHYYYNKSSGNVATEVAFALHGMNDASKQRIIWNSDLSKNIVEPPDMTKEEKTLIEDGRSFKNASNNAKIKLIENPEKAKVEKIADYKGQNEKDYYVIGPIKVNFESFGTDGEINHIEIYSDNKLIETITDTIDDEYLKEQVKSDKQFFIKLEKSKYKGIKEVKVRIVAQGTRYEGTYTKYYPKVYYDDDGSLVPGVNGQDLIKVNINKKNKEDYIDFNVKLTQPRLVTTKYIKSIKHPDGTISKIPDVNYIQGKDTSNTVPNSWDPADWGGNSNLKPRVTVDSSKDIEASDRYNLTPQGSNKLFNISQGDEIEYVIRVYNVGDGDAELNDTSLQATNKENGRLIVNGGQVFDYYDENYLEYVGGELDDYGNEKYSWEYDSTNKKYQISQEYLQNDVDSNNTPIIKNYTDFEEHIKEHNNNNPNDQIDINKYHPDDWSGRVVIRFRVKGLENASSNGVSFKNNGLDTTSKDEAKKMLYQQTQYKIDVDGNIVTDESGNPVVEETYTYGTAQTWIKKSETITSDNRIIYKEQAADALIMNGDVLKYVVRFYNTGVNDKVINTRFVDEFTKGLNYVSCDNGGGLVDRAQESNGKITVRCPGEIIKGLQAESVNDPVDYSKGDYVGTENGISFYDVVINFKVEFKPEDKLVYVQNKAVGKAVVNFLGYNISGRVFIDGKVYDEGKVTQPGNAKDGDSGDAPAEAVRVDLIDSEKNEIAKDIEENGIPYRVDQATGKKYESTVYTDENGKYIFKHLRYNEIWKTENTAGDSEEYHWLDWNGKEHSSSNPDDIPEADDIKSYKYHIRFTYNGQVYENVKYNVDNFEGNGSYSTEGGNVMPSAPNTKPAQLSRTAFNGQFATIDGGNSTDKYSLINIPNYTKEDLNEASPLKCPDYYWICAYTGKDGYGSEDGKGDIGIDGYTSYVKHVNLGLARREFDLSLENKLESMDISINGVRENITSINGATIKQDINGQDYQEVFFKEADYKAVDGTAKDKIEELDVWVNYKVTIKNESKDNFIGVLKKINFYYNTIFDDVQVIGGQIENKNLEENSNLRGIRILVGQDQEGIEIKNNADSKCEITIRLHLSRETIKNKIEDNEKITEPKDWPINTLETIAEIESYGTKYNGDIYNNGHGVGNPNAGKIDEDSDAGNFSLEDYVNNVRTSFEPKVVLEFFNKEDDCRRAVGIRLRKALERILNGRVFEDITTNNRAGDNTRLGDGTYEENKDKKIKNVTVELYEIQQDGTLTKMKVFDESSNNWNVPDIKSDDNGEFTIKGYIPSHNYVIKFIYGNGETSIYNAQDYKSTIDTTGNSYNQLNPNENVPESKGNYWYYQSIDNKSIAKDDDPKMKESQLTNSEAIKLEDYKNASQYQEIFENTATTARFCAPISWDEITTNDQYVISNMNLGLAERARSELTINKIVDHINIVTSDGRTLIDGSQGAANSTSWTDRYVQAIVDENLIYGSTLQITYKYFITNTGEKDYQATGTAYNSDGSIKKDKERQYYDYGKTDGLTEADEVTTKADTIIDYTDNDLRYDENMLAAPEVDVNTLNSEYWRLANDKDKELITNQEISKNNDARKEYDGVNTKLIAKGLNEKLTAGKSATPIYLTLSVKPSTAEASNKEALTYNNYVEILQSTNTAGRRSYHTNSEPNIADDPLTTQAYTKDGKPIDKEKNERIDHYEMKTDSDINKALLSDISDDYRGAPITADKIGDINDKYFKGSNNKILVLSIPGDLEAKTKSTLYFEPDSDADLAGGSVQIVPPFGNEKGYIIVIWVAIVITSGIILAVGIYLIKKKVLGNK